MSNMNHEEARARRQRQYEIDRITAQYEDDYRAGKAPRLEDYLQRYPDFARELKEFALYFHSIAIELPELDAATAAEPAPVAQQVLARIQSEIEGSEPLSGLVKQGRTVGYVGPKLADALGITLDLLSKLDNRVIIASSIPRTLIQRLAETLRISQQSVQAYLGNQQTAQAGGTFYYADQPPQQRQESFVDAVQGSPLLSADRKREWTEIIHRDLPDTQ